VNKRDIFLWGLKKVNIIIKRVIFVFIAFAVFVQSEVSSVNPYSNLVYPGINGYLVYRPTVLGDRVPDFTSVGYKGGYVPIPDVTGGGDTHTPGESPIIPSDRIITVYPVEGDDHPNIQAAIDAIEAKSLDQNGLRGVVQLVAGEYQIADTKRLEIMESGVVLRGVGDDSNETVLRAEGTDQRTLIVAGLSSGWYPKDMITAEIPGTSYEVIDKYVPVGAQSMRLEAAGVFRAGDKVIVHRRCNSAWISEIGMDIIPDDGDTIQWTEDEYQMYLEREVVRMDQNRIFLNAGLPTSIDQRWGGGRVYKYYGITGRINNVGIENIRGISDYSSDYDPYHSKSFIEFRRVEDGWVRNVTGVHFSYAVVNLNRYSKSITVENCSSLEPKGPREGGWRYPFVSSGQLHLFKGCYSEFSRHDYVTGSLTNGPVVFTDSIASQTNTEVGPHQRWANGLLFDRIMVSGYRSSLAAYNRGPSGTGHGWSGANVVFWNCEAPDFEVENPFTAQNWVIGGIGSIVNPPDFLGAPIGTYDSHNEHVALGYHLSPTGSLYTAQYNEKLLNSNSEFYEYVLGDFDLYDFNGLGSRDDVYVDPGWLSVINEYMAVKQWPVVDFDQEEYHQIVPFTFKYYLQPGKRVAFAVLVAAIKKTGNSTRNDSLWIEGLEKVNRVSFKSLGLGDELPESGTALVIYEFDGINLDHLQDGKLNAAFSNDVAVDWARLHFVTWWPNFRNP
jgi:hypothetical protein